MFSYLSVVGNIKVAIHMRAMYDSLNQEVFGFFYEFDKVDSYKEAYNYQKCLAKNCLIQNTKKK
jgi:hypothetical protein